VVLLEWRRGSQDELESLLESGPPFVMLVEEEDPAAIAAGLRAGLRAVLPRHASTAEIRAAIEGAGEGLIVLHPEIFSAMQFAEPARKASAELDAALTAREIEVLRMLAEGLANKNIAWKLGISEHTVKFHIASIFSKLHVSTRAEAVATGMRQGLILL
jgi:DNA-binding NarL/FixJ family response regulator